MNFEVAFTPVCIFVASVKLPAEKFSNIGDEGVSTVDSKKIVLNSSEQLYSELRNKNFKAVGAVLNRTAKLITAQADVCWGCFKGFVVEGC